MSRSLEAECAVFTRLLVGSAPGPYVTRKYADAIAAHARLAPRDAFERVALALARLGPWLARAADAHARLFAPSSALRKRLIVLLAILETAPHHHRTIDDPGVRSPAAAPLLLTAVGVRGVAALLLGAVLLLPVQLVARGR